MTEERETGWLIETGDHVYWDGKKMPPEGLTTDVNDAVRFARREDAERVIHWLMERNAAFLRASEHVWLSEKAA